MIYATSRGSAATSEAAVGAVDADVGVTLGLHIYEICVSWRRRDRWRSVIGI